MSFSEATNYVKERASRKPPVEKIAPTAHLQQPAAGDPNLHHPRATLQYVGTASPNLRSTDPPNSHLVMRNGIKAVRVDPNDQQRNNISSNSNKVGESPSARVDFRKPASFTYSNNSNRPREDSRPITTLTDSPNNIAFKAQTVITGTNPRHAINQLSNLHQSHQAIAQHNNRIYSPAVQSSLGDGQQGIASTTPIIRHNVIGDNGSGKNTSHPSNLSNQSNQSNQLNPLTLTNLAVPSYPSASEKYLNSSVGNQLARVTQQRFIGGHGSPMSD